MSCAAITDEPDLHVPVDGNHVSYLVLGLKQKSSAGRWTNKLTVSEDPGSMGAAARTTPRSVRSQPNNRPELASNMWSELRHKRKVQNFLPCKTPTRGPPHHLDATGVSAAHSVTYEDPDVHLGHHPLVMRHHHHHHHHNMELHHPKQLHYPSGYPMPRSPPLFICSSPGPDPYRSHDNVYEELEHPRDTDSEPPVQSDDDFAEDELSLPGDRSFHKSSSDGGTTVATIYHDRSASSNGGTNTDQYMERNRTERNSLLSSSSSGNDNNLRQGAGAAGTSNGSAAIGGGAGGSTSSSNNNRNSNSSSECASSASGNNNNPNGCVSGSSSNGSSNNNNNSNNSGTNNNSIGGLFRSRKQQPSTLGSGRGNKHLNNLNSLGEPPSELPHSLTTGCEERAMMTLPPSYQAAAAASRSSPNNLNNINNNSFVNSNSLNNNSSRGNYYSTINDECDPIERRNRINAQLSASSATVNNGGPGVSTIFRNIRAPYPGSNHTHHNHQTTNASNRSRTNPRSLDRRRYLINNNNNNNHSPGNGLAVISTQDPSQYIYHEPVFHEGLIYDACLSYSDRSSGGSAGPPYPYILPQFTTFRNHHGQQQNIYSRDGSFGSDSGYSQHTQASNRSVGWSRNRPPQPTPPQLNPTEPLPAATDS